MSQSKNENIWIIFLFKTKISGALNEWKKNWSSHKWKWNFLAKVKNGEAHSYNSMKKKKPYSIKKTLKQFYNEN